MKKYGLGLVSIALFFVTSAKTQGKDYVDVYVKNNLKEAIQVVDKRVESGKTALLGNSLKPYLVAQIFSPNNPSDRDDQTQAYKEALQKIHLHQGAVLLLTVSQGRFFGWNYTWQWVPLSELYEVKPAVQEEKAGLPPEVIKNIADKTLRVILDEAESNPKMLFEKVTPSVQGRVFELLGVAESPDTLKNINFIVKLLKSGADINLKNYKGNNILHLFAYADPDDMDVAGPIITLLLNNGIDIKAQNDDGNTVAHILAMRIPGKGAVGFRILEFLSKNPRVLNQALIVKNNDGYTPLELVKALVNAGKYGNVAQDYLQDIYDVLTPKK